MHVSTKETRCARSGCTLPPRRPEISPGCARRARFGPDWAQIPSIVVDTCIGCTSGHYAEGRPGRPVCRSEARRSVGRGRREAGVVFRTTECAMGAPSRPPCGRPPACDRFQENVAEGVGFEPTVSLHPRRFSRPMHSSTLPPLRADFMVSRGRSPNDSLGQEPEHDEGGDARDGRGEDGTPRHVHDGHDRRPAPKGGVVRQVVGGVRDDPEDRSPPGRRQRRPIVDPGLRGEEGGVPAT